MTELTAIRKQSITGFKRTQIIPGEHVLTCELWCSTIVDGEGVITIPFFRVLNSLPRTELVVTYPEGEPKLPAYENASIIFDEAKVPGSWLYFEEDLTQEDNRKIADGFIAWLRNHKKIHVIVKKFDDNTASNTTEEMYLDTTEISLFIIGNIQ